MKLTVQAQKQGLEIDPEWLKLIAAAKNMGVEISEVRTFLQRPIRESHRRIPPSNHFFDSSV